MQLFGSLAEEICTRYISHAQPANTCSKCPFSAAQQGPVASLTADPWHLSQFFVASLDKVPSQLSSDTPFFFYLSGPYDPIPLHSDPV